MMSDDSGSFASLVALLDDPPPATRALDPRSPEQRTFDRAVVATKQAGIALQFAIRQRARNVHRLRAEYDSAFRATYHAAVALRAKQP